MMQSVGNALAMADKIIPRTKKEYRRQFAATTLNFHLAMALTIIKHKYTFEILPSISITWLKGYIITLSWGTYTIDIQIK